MFSALLESGPRRQRLRDLPLLSDCTRKELAHVDRLGTEVVVRPGTTLIREGETGRECFLIESGMAVASRGNRRVGTISSGSITGELALLDRTPRSATVVTNTTTRLLVLTPRELSELLAVAPRIEARIEAIAAERRIRLDSR
jgi:CRP-like cAMP-binding protein